MDVILSKDSLKQYGRLSKPDQLKVRKKLSSLPSNPYAGKKLTGELIDIYSLRVWPYRILYEVNKRMKRIEILKIAHRQGAYK